MGFWELVENRMRVLGAVNLIVAFPQLANAIIVSRLSSNPSEEFRFRGWSDDVLRAMEILNSKISLGLLSELVDRLSSNNMFLENLSDILYYELHVRGADARGVYNYLSALDDLGENISPHVKCLDEDLAKRILNLTGNSIVELKSLDVAFTYKTSIGHGEPVDVETIEFSYACSPSWMVKTRDRIYKLVTLNSKTLEESRNLVENVIRGNGKMYSYLKLIVNLGVKKAYKLRNLLEPIPGTIRSVSDIVNIETPDSIPAFNYSVKDGLLEAMRDLEKKIIGSLDITISENVPLALVEDVPALIGDGSINEFNIARINGDEDRIVKSIAEKAGKNVNIEISKHVIKVTVKGE
ncbi:MAG: hypothetical protein P3X22_007040 [Thermoprotei archaeon]|nr:hypothetical protein [Thermoprotei archaeon]